MERLLAAEGHAPLASVEGDDEEFDEEEILGTDMDASDISKITPQEEEAALRGNVKVKKTPAKKAAKVSLKRTEPAPAPEPVVEKPVKSPAKKAAPVETETTEKGQENIEPAKKVIKVDEGDTEEKTSYEKRAERFGIPMTDEAKKLARAARFGELTNGSAKGSAKLSTVTAPVDVDKLKARAERFGEVTSKSLTKVDELEKKKQRMERFGSSTPAKADPAKADTVAVDEAKAARAARFAGTDTKTAKPVEKKTEKTEKVAEVAQ